MIIKTVAKRGKTKTRIVKQHCKRHFNCLDAESDINFDEYVCMYVCRNTRGERRTYISDRASKMTTPSERSAIVSGGVEMVEKLPKNSTMAA